MSAFSYAQTVATGYFELKNQEQVNAFYTQYPNVTKVDGSLLIGVSSQSNPSASSDITDLTGLSQLTEVTDDLMIAGIPAISNLDFLSNLETINGSLFLDDDSTLTNITGLSNLNTLGQTLAICMNESLTDLTGIQQFTTINQDLYIFGNKKLTSYEQMSNIQSIKGSLHIYDNPKITDLSGLQNLTNVDGTIEIANNPLLSDCTIQYFCNNINTPSKFEIHDNATGCASTAELEAACVLGTDHLIETSLTISPNPASTYLTLDADFQVEQVHVIDMTGKQVTVKTAGNQIDVSSLPAGFYTLQLNNNRHFAIGRFVIQ